VVGGRGNFHTVATTKELEIFGNNISKIVKFPKNLLEPYKNLPNFQNHKIERKKKKKKTPW
jgi:hypothetical protein